MEFSSSIISTCFLLLILTVHSFADGETSPTPYSESFLSNPISVQGMIYCKSGPNYNLTPLQGAVVRFTCVTEDSYGIETSPFSFLSDASDDKGYFFATLSPAQVPSNRKIVKQCSAFLELSPVEDCNVPTNINNGITGALLSSAQDYNDNNVKLYTVGPFFYTSDPQPASNNGY